MGRRPNAVIAEFFERGSKLEDASNRYQHTCRRCGELFPKGRVDSLMAHLLKRCLNVTQEDRNAIFLHMQQTPEHKKGPSDIRAGNKTIANGLVANGGLQPDLHLQNLPNTQQSALDTLAEVSRRHLDYSSQHNASFEKQIDPIVVQDSEQSLAEQELWAHLNQQTMDSSVGANIYDLPLHRGYDHSHTHTGVEQSVFSTESFAQAALYQTANAVNQQINRDQHVLASETNALDPQLGVVAEQAFVVPEHNVEKHASADGAETSVQPTEVEDQHVARSSVSKSDFIPWTPRPSDPGPHQSLGSMAVPSPPGNAKAIRSKPRGRFSESRRKEVRDIRKRGACIRCRMLKKPCSQGTPCETCARVATARMWKGKCLRTRLADEFGAWNTNHFQAMAHANLVGVTVSNDSHVNGRVTCRLFASAGEGSSETPLNLAFKKCRSGSLLMGSKNGQDASLPIPMHIQGTNDEIAVTDVFLLNEPDLSRIVAAHCTTSETTNAAIESETNRFFVITLRRAQQLLTNENSHGKYEDDGSMEREDSDKRQSRPGGNPATVLIRNSLELWILSVVLTTLQDPAGASKFGAFAEIALDHDTGDGSSSEPCHDPESLTLMPQSVSGSSPSYHFIRLQLLAAAEMRTAKLGKTVMSELERRLLQRQQVDGFATLIAAVILLNSIERMTAYFHHLDPEASHESHMQMASADDSNINGAGREVTDSTPTAIWRQGGHFASLLTMLLRMRGLPPRTAQDEKGQLAVIDDSGAHPLNPNTTSNGQSNVSPDEARTVAMRDWLSECSLNADEVKAWMQGTSEGWVGKFMCGVLIDGT